MLVRTRLMLALAVALFAVSFGVYVYAQEERPAAPAETSKGSSPGSATTSTSGAPAWAPPSSFPATRAERLAVDYLNERFAKLASENNELIADAKRIRNLPDSTRLTWDSEKADGGWKIVPSPAAVAPLSSVVHPVGVAPAPSDPKK